MLSKILRAIADELPLRIIPRGDDPYLERYRLLDTPWFSILLHRFCRSDADPELHNHPWSWALSWILTGGYVEERFVSGFIYKRVVRPGRLNLIMANTFHRVDLLKDDAWTLFITGPRTQDWGFVDRRGKNFVNWKTFVSNRDSVLDAAKN